MDTVVRHIPSQTISLLIITAITAVNHCSRVLNKYELPAIITIINRIAKNSREYLRT